MMSTFSRVSGNQDDVIGDEDDDDPSLSTASFQNLPADTSIASKPPDDSFTSNGTDKLSDGLPSDGKYQWTCSLCFGSKVISTLNIISRFTFFDHINI